jgi:RNA polymerase sigma factor (sigma-70 family)
MRREGKAISKSEIWDLLGALHPDRLQDDRLPTRTRLVRAYESLHPQQQNVLRLEIDGWTQQEIADELGTSQPTVSRLLARAKTRFAAALA